MTKQEFLTAFEARELTDTSDGTFIRIMAEIFQNVRAAASRGESFCFLPHVEDATMMDRIKTELQIKGNYDLQTRYDKVGIAW